MTSVGSWHCGSRFSFFLFGLLHFFGLKVLKYKSCENIFQRDYYSIFFFEQIFYIFRSILFFYYKFVTFFILFNY